MNNRSAAGTDRPAAGRRQAFASAVVSLTAAFAASASPIPLFNTYRAEQGFTNADISLAVVSYVVGTITPCWFWDVSLATLAAAPPPSPPSRCWWRAAYCSSTSTASGG